MPINYGMLSNLNQEAKPLMGEAPSTPQMSGGGDGGIGELMQGMGQLGKAINGPSPAVSQGMPQDNPDVSSAIGQTIGVSAAPQDYKQNNANSFFDLAKQHLGQNEAKDAPVLMSFFQKTLGQNVNPQSTPWCAAYANAILKSGGVEGTGSLAARSFLNWGQETKQPSPGDIVVLSRGNDQTKGHVGFYAGTNQDGSIQVLGGNQGDSVSMKSFPSQQVLGYRRPPNGDQIKQAVAPQDASPVLPQVMQGIAHVESQGSKDPYSLQSKPSKNGDHAYGKYQIMGKNIPSWTKEATGTAMSPQQFLSDPAAQEKTAAFHLNKSLQKGYSPEDTASIWFSGRPASKAGNAKDAYGTSVPQYINRFKEGFDPDSNKYSHPNASTISKPRSPEYDEALQRIAPNPGPPAMSVMPYRSAVAPQGQLGQVLANSSNPMTPPNIRPFQKNVPIRDLSPKEQEAIMRWQSTGGKGVLGGGGLLG